MTWTMTLYMRSLGLLYPLPVICSTSMLAATVRNAASRGKGSGMGGGGHANHPVFTFQKDWAKNPYKGFVFAFGIFGLG